MCGCISICSLLAESLFWSVTSLSWPSYLPCWSSLLSIAYLICCNSCLPELLIFGFCMLSILPPVSVNCRHKWAIFGPAWVANLDWKLNRATFSKCDLTRRLVLIFFFLSSVYYNWKANKWAVERTDQKQSSCNWPFPMQLYCQWHLIVLFGTGSCAFNSYKQTDAQFRSSVDWDVTERDCGGSQCDSITWCTHCSKLWSSWWDWFP